MESVWVQSAIGAIKIITMVYDIITMPIYLAIQRPWKRRQLARRVKVSNRI